MLNVERNHPEPSERSFAIWEQEFKRVPLPVRLARLIARLVCPLVGIACLGASRLEPRIIAVLAWTLRRANGFRVFMRQPEAFVVPFIACIVLLLLTVFGFSVIVAVPFMVVALIETCVMFKQNHFPRKEQS